MTRITRAERVQQAQSRLAAVAGARNGVALAAVEPDDQGATSAELWLYGIVGGYYWGFNDKTVADQLRGLNVDHITVRINSPGGDAVQGIAIGNLLRNHKASVTVVVDGLAASAASIIAIAGDEIVMSPGSQMMIHDPWFFTLGNAKELRQDADFLDKQGGNLAGVYAHEAGGTPETWRTAMTAEPDGTWYSADEAVTAKLATRVGTVVAIAAAPEPPTADLDEDDDMAARAAWDLDVLITPAARAAWSNSARTGAPKPPAASAPGTTPPEGAAVVDLNDEQIASLRKEVGFPDTADADTIVQATLEALAERAEGNTTTQIPDGMKLVSATVFDDVSAKAERGAKAAAELLDMQCNTVLDKYRDRYPATTEAREKWAADYKRDPAGTEAYLKNSAVLVPTSEEGHGGDGVNQATAVKDDPNYKNWSW